MLIKPVSYDLIAPLQVIAQKEGILFRGGIEFYGAYIEETLVGFCGVKLGKRTAWLKSDYVFPSYRRRGILTEMIKYRLELLRVHNCKKVYASCTLMAIGAHIRLGAEVVQRFKNGIIKVRYHLL